MKHLAYYASYAGGSKEVVVCPKCGVQHKAYFISTRKQWRCKHCRHTFSITSGTIFANHKLPIQTYLFAIVLFVNVVKGISACQLSRDLNVQYKTAFTLSHKIRESLIVQRELFPLSGEIHIDGTYVHSAPRPKNKKVERVDRRLKQMLIQTNVRYWLCVNVTLNRKPYLIRS